MIQNMKFSNFLHCDIGMASFMHVHAMISTCHACKEMYMQVSLFTIIIIDNNNFHVRYILYL